MPYRIGIDLDNTILFYESLFHSLARTESWIDDDCPVGKSAIKENLKSRCGDDILGEQRWQQIQAWAYGKNIAGAEIEEGFLDFIRQARSRGDELFIVSHKTEFSEYDPAVNLRQHALDTLNQRGFFRPLPAQGLGFSPADVFFVSSLEEKNAKIAELELTHFIDDLPKVLLHPEFPAQTARLWFSRSDREECRDLPCFRHWRRIGDLFALRHWLESVFPGRQFVVRDLPRSGNNRIFRVKADSGDEWAVKHFLSGEENSRARLDAEFGHLNALWQTGIRNIPQPIRKGDYFAAYSMVQGTPVESVGQPEMEQVLSFIADLRRVGPELRRWRLKPASDSRSCLGDYPDTIERRWRKIMEGCREASWGKAVTGFLEKEALPIKELVRRRFEEAVRREKFDLDRRFSPEEQFFSPSDFGFHNVLADKKGRLVFLDFEYSGWDDPAKLVADFFHHAGQRVAWKYKWFLLDRVARQREDDPGFLRRWNAVIDLIGFEWILIALNVAAPNEMRRKQFANPGMDPVALIDGRLKRARETIREIKERIALGEPYATIPSRTPMTTHCP